MGLKIIFMDSGQGDCTLIINPDKSLVLIDCGSRKNKQIVSTQIEQVLDRTLARTNNHLKALVLTHPDADHYNLINEQIVNRRTTIGAIYYGMFRADYPAIEDWLRAHNNTFPFNEDHGSLDVVPGLSYQGTGPKNLNVDVRILSANAGNKWEKKDANANSIVLLVSYGNLHFFLMGDSTDKTERFIIRRLGTNLKKLITSNNGLSILKVGHHGSYTSTSDAWLSLVKPKVAFISSDTLEFGGTVSLPRSGVINSIINEGSLETLPRYEHNYVQYNDSRDRHEQKRTQLGLYTTLHLLKFAKNDRDFTAYGTSWYYEVADDGDIFIYPACGWDDVNKPF